MAWPTPMANTTSTRAVLFGSPLIVSPVSTADMTSCSTATAIRRRRRSRTSASAPPMSENTRSGPSWANTMRPTKLAESVSSSANAPSTAFCIQEPMLEPNAPQYRRRNVGYPSAARAVPGVIVRS